MKIIDLLNKIANGEEVPKRIKYYQNYYSWFNGFSGNNGYCKEPLQADGNSFLEVNTLDLNGQLEILEEEKKIPEKLGYQDNADGTFYLNRKKYNSEPIKILSKKINEIIDYLDYLKSKGDE